MEVATIQAADRKERGSNKVAYLRGDGRIPGVVYGGKGEAQSISVDAHEMKACLRKHLKVYRVQLSGGEQPTYLKDIQWDAITDQPLHLDFLRIEMDQPIRLKVQLQFIGYPVGGSKGGTLVKDQPVLMLDCLPEAIPEAIEVNVGPVDLGDKILAKDVKLPEGCKLAVAPDSVVCRMPE